MNLLKQSAKLLLCSTLLLGSVDVYSAPPAKKGKPGQAKGKSAKDSDDDDKEEVNTSSSSYSKDFCSPGGSEAMMKKLNEANKSKFAKIDKLRAKIKDIAEYNAIVNQVTALRDKYESSLKNIATAGKSGDKNQDIAASLDNMKMVVRNGLTLNALSLLMKEEDLSKPETFTMAGLCKNSANAEQTICDKEYNKKLDGTLKNFKEAYQRLPDSETQLLLKNDVTKLVSQIPKDIAPEAILKLIEEKSPRVGKLLANDFPREKLIKCLDQKSTPDSLTACQGIIDNPKDREALFKSVTSESRDLSVTVSKNLSSIIDQSASARKDDLARMLENYNSAGLSGGNNQFEQSATSIMATARNVAAAVDLSQLRTKEDNESLKNSTRAPADSNAATSSIQAKKVEADDVNSGLANLFYTTPDINNMAMSEAQEKQDAAFAIAKDKAKKLQNACDFAQSKSANIKECRTLLSEVSDKVRYIQNKHVQEMTALQNEINTIKKDPEFVSVEKLKKYVFEKYLRNCGKDVSNMRAVSNDLKLDMNVGGCALPAQINISKIEGLSKSVAEIFINTEFTEEIKGVSDDAEYEISTKEMASAASQCALLTPVLKSNLSDVCGEVKADNNRRDIQLKEPEKFAKLNKEGYFTYDETAPGKYRYTKKKPLSHLIAPAVVSMIPNLFQGFFMNLQAKQSTAYLTDQAIYQKQMLYNVDFWNKNGWNSGLFADPFTSLFANSGVGTSSSTLTTTTSGVTSGFTF